uniref:Putative ribonuclease H-like domain-containing protein n=1 Tax=Tanacetum cinerariifolium TaxID=118510 RepID=A0A6L2JR61_TANCI|nr:putative ribonuclease H-like domain-containing protein [Tanacetum cinerariifolium]
MESQSTPVIFAAKLPILNPNEFDLWKIRIEQYLLMTDYSLWEVILNGDSLKPSVVVEKLVSQLKIHRVSISQEDLNLKFLRSLPSEWKTHTLIWRNKTNLEEHNLDDLFNSLRIYEAEVKHSSSPGNPTQNIAFVSSSNTDSTTDSVGVATSVSAICAQLPVSSYLNIDSLSNTIDVDDFEEMDLRWQMAMLTMRARHFLQKTERNLGDNRVTTMGFDMFKVECYNCHRKGHFAQECSYDWSYQAEEEPTNFALMAISSSSSSDNEVSTAKPPQVMSHTTESMAPIIEDWVSDSEDESKPNDPKSAPCFVQPSEQVKPSGHFAQPVEAPILDHTPKPISSKTNGSRKRKNRKTCFVCRGVDHLIKDCTFYVKPKTQPTPRNYVHRGYDKQYASSTKKYPQKHRVPATVFTKSKPVSVTAARPVSAADPKIMAAKPRHVHSLHTKNNSITRRHQTPSKLSKNGNSSPKVTTAHAKVVSAAKGKKGKWGNPQYALKDKGVIDSNPKGGKITGKGKIKTGKLDFEDVYFVKELKFNLFSVSQMYDKKNKVLFADSECLVLSLDFKLPDESQVLLRVPRENNMYNVNLKDIVPSEDLTCLFAKATIDESNLWHRRLGHVNFKTINTLVKGNLVRGLPTKVFENQNTCVACRKGKQHRASLDSLREFSAPRTPQQNGIAERKNRTLIEAARTMLADSLLLIPFWSEAVNTACYVQNRVLVTKPQNKTPYELFHGRTPSIGFMRPFGCPVTILNTLDPLGKFEGKTNLNAGFQEEFDAGKIGEEANQQYILFPVWSTSSTNPQNNEGDTTFDGMENHFEDFSKDSSNDVSAASPIVPAAGQNCSNSTNPISVVGPSSSNSSSTHGNSSLRDASQSPDVLEIENIVYSDNENVGAEADFNNLESSITEKRAIGTKWVYKNKKDKRGIVVRNKARLVAQGHTQEEGIDYEKVFAPVARIEAIRLFLAYASFIGFMVYQMDVKSAFLYKIIEEEVYMCQPPGFEDPDHPDKVYKVVKALYGLHQSPRAWYETLANYLLQNGFHRGQIDQTLFIKKQKGDILLVQIYVDDIIFVATNKDLSEILKKFGLTKGKSASTPIDIEKPLLKDPDGDDVDVHIYISMIGSLMYLTLSRPDIMFVVYACDLPFDLVAYSDGDYAGASQDRKSTTGGCQFLRSRLISWQCKKQTVVATSSTKAEFVAGASCYAQVLWIQNQMLDYGKSDASEGFDQIIDFINGSYIAYALTVNPLIYLSCIKQFWKTVAVKSSNDVTRLQALVDKKKVIVTEAAIRDALHLDDAEGVDCLPNEKIFNELARMGYEKPTTKLTFYKAFFSSQVGKGCLSVKTPLFEGMLIAKELKNQGNTEVEGDEEEQGTAAKEPVTAAVDDDQSNPSPTPLTPPPQQPQDIPSTSHVQSPPTQHQSLPLAQPRGTHFPLSLLQEALDACTTLARRVEHLEHDKVAQDLEILKLKSRVKNLERANKVKSVKLRRLRKVRTSQRIESSADTIMEDVSNQGRMIEESDKDEAAKVVNEEEETEEVRVNTADAQVEGMQAKIYHINMDHAAKVLSMQEEEEPEVQEAVEVFTTTKLITEVVVAASGTVSAVAVVPAPVTTATVTPEPVKVVVPATRRRRGVIIRDPEEESSTNTPTETKSKDKGKGILVEEPKPMKKKEQVEMDEAFARKLQEELDYFKELSYDDIRLIFKAKFNSSLKFLLKTEQIEEEESRAIAIINEVPAQKAAKRRRLNEEAEDVEKLKQHLEIMPDEDDDLFTEVTPLARKVPVVVTRSYIEDLETLWNIVKERTIKVRSNVTPSSSLPKLWLVGEVFYDPAISGHAVRLFKTMFKGAYAIWKKVPQDHRDRYSDIMRGVRKAAMKVTRVNGNVDIGRISSNHLIWISQSGKHTSGSRSFLHTKIVMEKQKGRKVKLVELHTAVHTKKGLSQKSPDQDEYSKIISKKNKENEKNTEIDENGSKFPPDDFEVWKGVRNNSGKSVAKIVGKNVGNQWENFGEKSVGNLWQKCEKWLLDNVGNL